MPRSRLESPKGVSSEYSKLEGFLNSAKEVPVHGGSSKKKVKSYRGKGTSFGQVLVYREANIIVVEVKHKDVVRHSSGGQTRFMVDKKKGVVSASSDTLLPRININVVLEELGKESVGEQTGREVPPNVSPCAECEYRKRIEKVRGLLQRCIELLGDI